MSFLSNLFTSRDVLPHGFCYQWNPFLVWCHAISDLLIALAYFSIPVALLWFVKKRRDLPFSWMFVCFAVFIAACGMTHLVDVWTLWIPSYRFSAAIRALTALASLPTALYLVQLVPRALLIPSIDEVTAINLELRQQDAVLRESEERFRQMADNIQEIVWMTDPRTQEILYVNSAFESICEIPLGVIRANPTSYRELIHPDDRSRVLAALDNLAASGRFEEEFRIVCPSGKLKWIRALGSTANDQFGKVLRLVGTAQDVTIRREMEDKLRDSEDRYRDLVEHSTDLICTHTLDGFLLSVNELPVRLLGYSREELLNKPMQEFLSPEFREEFQSYLGQVRDAGFAKGQMLVVSKSGEKRIWEFNNTLRTDGVNKPLVRGVAHDITERKEAENQLRLLSQRLLHSQDEERRKIARDLHDSTGQDLVALSTILNSLHSVIPSQKRALRKSVSQCEQIVDRTLREVRTLSYVLHPPMLDEGGLEDAVRHYTGGYAPRTGIEVQLDISANFGRLPRDTEMGLFQVIRESLLNIQRHSGSKRARIRLHREITRVSLEVSDEGRGIPEAMRGLGKKPSSLGVGIPSMEERVKQVGGSLHLESGVSGTCVRVTVPIHEQLQ